MVRKRASLIIVILMLFVQYAYGVGFFPQVKAAAIEQDRDIMTSVSMAVYGPDGGTVTGSVYDLDSTVTLDYTWALPDGHSYVLGDSFTFQLPAQFELFNDIQGGLVSDEGDVGTFTVSKATHQVVMTFNDYIQNHDNVQGTLRINTKFDKQVIGGTTVQQILFPISGGIQTVTVAFMPVVGSTIEKRGVSSGFNADHIRWTVDVNKRLEAVSNAVVTDPVPAGLALDSTVTVAVYQLNVLLDGTVTEGPAVDSSKYTADVSGGTLVLRFTDPVITGAYRIVYTTPVVSDSLTSFTNTATFSGDGRTPVSDSDTVVIERGASINKKAVSYDWGNQTISWAIEYNYNNRTISPGNAVLTDLFNASQSLVPGSLRIYPVTLDSAGQVSKGAALNEGTDYTVTPASTGAVAGFKLEFASTVNVPYLIEYKTKAVDRVFSDTTITNTVSDSTYSDQATQLIRPAIIYKNLSGVNYTTHITDWKITLNGDNYPMSGVVVTDGFPDGGQKYIEGSLVVRNGSGTVLSPSAYSLVAGSPVQPNESFKVIFNGPVSGTHTISYKTEFSNDWLTGSTDNFINLARIDWKDSDNKPQTAEARGLFIPNSAVKNNGFKAGTYDASAKRVTWNIGVNYNSKIIADPVVTDILNAGQALIPGTVKVYRMNIASDGSRVRGAEVSSSAYSYSVGSGNELRVNFQNAISSPYYVVFSTSLEGQLIGKTIENTAKLLDGTKPVSSDLKASVNIPHGDEYLYKDGVQAGDRLQWTITINRTQSHVKDAMITDVPSSNQILLPETFHLYRAVTAVHGDISKSGPELVRGTDYSLNISADEGGKQTFVLSFLQDIDSAYVLEYDSLIVANTGDKLTNTVNFSGNNVVTVSKDTSKEIIVGVSSGSGTGNGVRGTLNVHKLDAGDNTKVLAGATFELYRLNGSDRVLVNTRTTDASGKAVFNNIWLGSYVLVETAAPAGYVLDRTEYPVNIGSSAAVNLTVLNALAEQPTATPTLAPTPTSTSTPLPSETAAPTEAPAVTPGPGVSPVPTPAPTDAPAATAGPGITPTPVSTVVPGIIIDDPAVPAGPGLPASAVPTSTSTVAVNTPESEIPVDDQTPLGGVEIEDDAIPEGTASGPDSGGTLPQTGESSPLPIYLAGMALILAGFILTLVFRKTRKQ
ncbi:collagen binding domain-containing protein [Paenibacillus sp. MMS20-IR301]|uniref:collagen binding domain-containing protein n=1 Tax=Paenibacillus sp. MMS20-IR301 TaxID=2895946 RepID=UPI0028E63598|nr:collagen binding domain-containing protein [Paenibacillus sp. MMS20-IR301]WNS44434.1 collagen binding domain-containing protein [Paenibacillus sp. MMS20-IR301]